VHELRPARLHPVRRRGARDAANRARRRAGASLAFHTAESGEADFAAGIGNLAAAGAKVIADDVGYFDEPYYQDGIVAQAIDAVEAKGVAYFSAAGNDGDASYENTSPSFATLSSSGSNSASIS